jgi:aspartyl protease family protein
MSRTGCSFAVAAVLLVGAIGWAAGVDVQVVAVSPGRYAVLAISGGAPITVEVGRTVEGVTVLKADRSSAVIRVHGVTKTLPLVAYHESTGGGTGEIITLRADGSGHFLASGAVNGAPMRFIVDTGATFLAIDRANAKRIGIDYRRGTPVQSMTVNGVVRGWRVTLDSVRVGDTTERHVVADVVDNDLLPEGLLGMSYLNRFDMQRQGQTLVLRRRN